MKGIFRKRPDGEPEAAPAPAGPEGPALRVVVVDDTEDVRDLMRFTLEGNGFEIVGEADNGRDAIEVVGQQQPDLIVLDLHMPEQGGLDVLPDLLAECATAKVVVFSAIGAMHMTEAVLEAGAVGFIHKGVSPSSIVKHMHRVADSGRAKIVRPYPLLRDYED